MPRNNSQSPQSRLSMRLVVGLLAAAITACTEPQQPPAVVASETSTLILNKLQKDFDEVNKRLKELDEGNKRLKELDEVNKRVKELEQEVSALKFSVRRADLLKQFDETAFLKPGDSAYSIIRFDLGQLTFVIADVTPYASGSRVAIRVGNPTSATINNLKATFDYGSLDAKGEPVNASVKQREVTFAQSLRPGSWTVLDLPLEGMPPQQLGFVRVRGVQHSGISLHK